MKPLLNTLYVTTHNSYLAKEGDTIVIKQRDGAKRKIPIHLLEQVVCFGSIGVSPELIYRCSMGGISIAFLSRSGRFWGTAQGLVSGNVLLRRAQYRRADDPLFALSCAKMFVLGKLANSRLLLMRASRETADVLKQVDYKKGAAAIADAALRLKEACALDTVRAIEGEAAKIYFSYMDGMILNKPGFVFSGRNKHPPSDEINALLSFVYVLLLHDVKSALAAVGLDPFVGFLHADRSGRVSLACDVMEELRACFADRLVLSLVNRKQLEIGDFERLPTGAVKMSDAARLVVLKEYHKRKQAEIVHPFLDEKIAVGLIPFVQAQLLARHIRGELACYPPFYWR